MDRADVIQLIENIVSKPDAFDRLETELQSLSRESLSNALFHCGIIPEAFPHDSSAEKLWAKYCDILFSLTLNALGIESQVIRARGDSADVFGKTPHYSIVGDAKAFRLSRTAKNQKDFKVSALDDWRKGNTYACLVAPLYQYPMAKSQIYAQAITKNVTLISYVHVRFLLDHSTPLDLEKLWMMSASLIPSKDANLYWTTMDSLIVELTRQSLNQLNRYKNQERDVVRDIGTQAVQYWQDIITQYYTLSQPEAVNRLIRAEKLDQKINTIQLIMKKIEELND